LIAALAIGAGLTWTVRFIWGYAYDTPLAIISIAADLGVVLVAFAGVGSFRQNKELLPLRIAFGIAFSILVFVLFCLLHVNFFLSTPTIWLHLIATITFIFLVWRSRGKPAPSNKYPAVGTYTYLSRM